MASPQGTHPNTSHHNPGAKVIYGSIHPKISSYTPNTPPKSPMAGNQHQSSRAPCSPHSYSQHDQASSAIKELQEEISKLQLVDASRAEAITEQKIEIAVLKNELEHARRDKEAVISSFGIVIESITRGACVTPSPQVLAGASTVHFSGSESRIQALEQEIERYRKSDRLLRSRIQDLDRGVEGRGRVSDISGTHRDTDGLCKEIGWMENNVGSQVQAPDRGKAELMKRELGCCSGSANPPQSQQEGWRTNEPELSTSQVIGGWGDNLDDDARTIRNDWPSAESIVHPAHIDVGMCSLEDLLDNDGMLAPISAQPSSIPSAMVLEFPPSITAHSSSLSAGNPMILEDERHIDEQIEENKKAMAALANIPTPGVIKTGFTLEGSFRGADYNKMKPSYPLRDFDRFSPNFRNINREGRTGPGTAFEAPEDRSLNQGLWTDSQDRNGAVEAHMRAATGRNDTRFPDIFRYGIQYIPAEGDSNFLRTVKLSNLPLDMEVRDVLARVRGGDVLSATIVKMGKIAPGTMHARVVFKHEAAAEEYVLYAAEHPISFGEDNVAEVTLVETPTYPLHAKQISRLREQTRCIAVLDIPSYFSINQLEHDLACGNGHRAKSLIEMWIDEDYTLHLEFANVDMAGSAWAILHAWNAYRGLECRWEADPCAGEVEELANGVKPRPKVFPEDWGIAREKDRGVNDNTVEASKRLAALGNQIVSIPDFNATKLKAASWADEVNDGLDDEDDEDDAKVKIFGKLVSGGSGTGSSESDIGEGHKSASSSLTPADESSEAPDAKSQNTSSDTEGNPSFDHRQKLDDPSPPISSLPPSTSAQIMSPSITVLTVNQELEAALLASNTNKDLANSTPSAAISTTISPKFETRKSLIGLAGSKYASDIPGFVDTGMRPRSIHINTSSRISPKTSPTRNYFKATSTSDHEDILLPGNNLQARGPKLQFSASPPRVDLQCLIKSERSSFASAGASEPAAESEAETYEIDGDLSGVDSITKPRVQLFKWFQLPGGKKRGYRGREQEVESKNLEASAEEVRTASTKVQGDSLKVVNPDEIDLSGDDDEVMVDAEKNDSSTGSEAASSTSDSTDDAMQAIPQGALQTSTHSGDQPLEKNIECANKLTGYSAKDSEVCC
ncbi:hypothetical protein ONS96_012296 [Cadophora gregata f. sp. sojae]|nr:hypothetical protein ONS96_012296 [Cadophora gregata f. sp. sojae]